MAGSTQETKPAKRLGGRPKKKTATPKKEAPKVETPKEPLSKPTAGEVKVRVTEEIFREVPKKGGGSELKSGTWLHSVKYGGKFHNEGDVFSCDAKTAEVLLASGVVQKESDKKEPYMPPALQGREMRMSFGVVKKSDVEGKIPKGSVVDGVKGEWEDDIDDD